MLLLLLFVTLLGLGLRSIGLINDHLKDLLYRYVYYLAVPAAIIYTLSGQINNDIGKYGVFLIANIFAYLLVFFGVSMYAKYTKYSYKTSGVLRFSSNTPNSIFLGFPLIFALFDHKFFIYAVLLGTLADTIINAIRIAAIQTTVKSKKRKPFLKNAINPLTISIFIVCLLAITGLVIPAHLDGIIRIIGKTSSYTALLVLGVSLYGLHIKKKDIDILAQIAALKLFIQPLVVLLICSIFGVTGEARFVSVIVSALPVAVFSLIVADNLGLEERVAAGAVLVTTCLAPFTLVLWFLILQHL